jgi:hypothetical protein
VQGIRADKQNLPLPDFKPFERRKVNHREAGTISGVDPVPGKEAGLRSHGAEKTVAGGPE